MLNQDVINKLEAINLFERYKSISIKYNSEKVLELFDKELVLERLKQLNCGFTYDSREGFFALSELDGDIDFRFNLSLKYGMVEPIIWGKNLSTNQDFGGVLVRVTKLLQISQGVDNIERIMNPRYSNYEELYKIVSELFSIYLDFKNAFTQRVIDL